MAGLPNPVSLGLPSIDQNLAATWTQDDLNYVLDVLEKLGHEFQLIGPGSMQEKLAQLAKAHF